ncbi:hypothetical protein F5884DRAFT_800791 [Xylogone sp. PMI_703]|nr:hypothetical protein F5884DRAFT_800791 [Xylogone sp. PMI_703]
MDDPWGSPWADEGPDAIQKPVNAIAKPVAPVKESSIGEKINSPWDDEDEGFGDWSAAPESGLQTTAALDITLRQDSDADNGRNDLLAPKNEVEQQSPAWGHTSPLPLESDLKLSPIPPLQLDQNVQPPSDPWITSDENQTHLPRLETNNVEWHGPDAGDSTKDEQKQSLSIDNGVEHAEIEEPKSEDKDVIKDAEQQALSPPGVVSAEPEQPERSDHDSSRPSSSNNSQYDDKILPESPRTSVDEPGRPRSIKESPSKEHSSPGHFDSPVEEEGPAPVESKDEVSETEPTDVAGDEFGDFGDFEEGMSGSGDVFAPDEAPEISSPKTISPEPITDQKEDFSVLKEHGPISFTIDTSQFGRLFPNVEATELASVGDSKIFIPDTIPRDNFSTAEQRKTWYRISRYGTMRQYNSGDDENYTRVDWNHSKARDETLKIVARWMEEDRITGRVTLGGSGRGSVIFGWDKKNAAVPISAALATKHESEKTKVEIPLDSKSVPGSIVSPKSPTIPKSPFKERRRSSAASSIDIKTRTSVDVPQFGWNTATNSTADNISVLSSPKSPPMVQPAVRTKLPPIVPPSNAKPPSAVQPLSTVAQQAASPRPNISRSTGIDKIIIPPVVPAQSLPSNAFSPIIPPTIPPTETIDDDDDWGEMVSSPVVTSAPSLPSPVTQPHEQSMSIAGTSPRNAHPSQDPRDLLRRGHKTTASLSDISTNNTKTPIADLSQPPLTAGLTTNGFSDFFSSLPSNTTSTAQDTTSTTSAFDPWAAADFSVFEKPSTAAPQRPASTIFSSPPSRGIVKASKRPASFAAPFTPSPLRNQQTPAEIEQEEIFKKIIAGLPDLSYMMRR